jgi:hypothetical protein
VPTRNCAHSYPKLGGRPFEMQEQQFAYRRDGNARFPINERDETPETGTHLVERL